MQVAALYNHPLTGAHRNEEQQVFCNPSGMIGDRWWVLYDAAKSPDEPNRVSQKRYKQLATVGARLIGDFEVLFLAVPQAKSVEVMHVPFTEQDPNCEVNEFGDKTPAVDAGDHAAAIFASFLGLESVRLAQKSAEWITAGGMATRTRKQMPFHIVTTGSIEALRRSADFDFGPERFRPNIIIETDEPFIELDWIGKSLRFEDGPAIVIERPTPRCPVPGFDQETGVNMKDVPKLYDQLSKDEKGTALFGVYGWMLGSHIKDGRSSELSSLRLGQEVRVHESS